MQYTGECSWTGRERRRVQDGLKCCALRIEVALYRACSHVGYHHLHLDVGQPCSEDPIMVERSDAGVEHLGQELDGVGGEEPEVTRVRGERDGLARAGGSS